MHVLKKEKKSGKVLRCKTPKWDGHGKAVGRDRGISKRDADIQLKIVSKM